MEWLGPRIPCPPRPDASSEAWENYNQKYTRYLERRKEYWNHVYYWDRWFMKVYRCFSIDILGKDPKPYFDIRY